MAYILNIPYVGQVGTGSNEHGNDCGATCVAMVLQSMGISTPNVDDLFNKAKPTGDSYLNIADLLIILGSYGISADFETGISNKDLWSLLSSGIAPIALIRYGGLSSIRPNKFTGSHFVVVVGIDLDTVYIHDPLNCPTQGKNIAIPLSVWGEAWSTVGDDNPQRSLLIPIKTKNVTPAKYVSPVAIDGINVRSKAGDLTDKTKLFALPYGTRIPIYFERDGWGKISATNEQWISLAYVRSA